MPIRNPRWLPMQDIVLTQYHIGKYRKNLFLKNYWAEWTHSVHEWSLNGLFIKFVFFVMIWNPRWPPLQVIVLTQDHMGKYRNIFFSEDIALIEPNLCINHWKVLYKLCVFYVDRNSKMTTTAGHSFYIGPIGSFYNQMNDTGSWEPLVYLCSPWRWVQNVFL